jgi:hypothetical protein
MGRPNPQTQGKRQREQAKKDKRRDKDMRRAARKAAKVAATDSADGDSPAAEVTAGGLGPQPPPVPR